MRLREFLNGLDDLVEKIIKNVEIVSSANPYDRSTRELP